MYGASQVVTSADLSNSQSHRHPQKSSLRSTCLLSNLDGGIRRRLLEMQIRSGNILKPRRWTQGTGMERDVAWSLSVWDEQHSTQTPYCSSSSTTTASPSNRSTAMAISFCWLGGVLEHTGAPQGSQKRFVRVAERRAVRNIRNSQKMCRAGCSV